MVNFESILAWTQVSQSRRRGKPAVIQFKRIFSNNKRKVLYEISGKIDFEGEDLSLKLEEITCSGDR
jgi:hypothetical protein